MAQKKGVSEHDRIQALIHYQLRRRASLEPPLTAGAHLDEDALAAFTEGRLAKSESTPIISHLVDCAFCRRTTARLIHLAAELGGTQTIEQVTTDAEPGRLKRLLESLAARVLPSPDEVVFAYHARSEETEKQEENNQENQGQAEE